MAVLCFAGQQVYGFAGQQVYKTTRLLVGAAAGGIRRNYGTTESRIDGLTELWNYG